MPDALAQDNAQAISDLLRAGSAFGDVPAVELSPDNSVAANNAVNPRSVTGVPAPKKRRAQRRTRSQQTQALNAAARRQARQNAANAAPKPKKRRAQRRNRSQQTQALNAARRNNP